MIPHSLQFSSQNRALLNFLVRSEEQKSVAIDQDDGSHYYEARSLTEAMAMVQYWRYFMRGTRSSEVGWLLPAIMLSTARIYLSPAYRRTVGDALRRVRFGFSVESTRGWLEGSWENFYFRSPVCSSIDESIILCKECDYCY